MASIRPQGRTVVVVVDVQVDVMAGAWDAPRVVSNVALVVQRARERGVPVIWVQHEAPDLPRDSAGWQWVPGLQPAPGEGRVYKHYESSFEDTDLEAQLQGVNASHITLAGAATNWCIRATAYAALDRGYDLTLVQDAHTTKDTELAPGERIQAKHLVADLNQVMTWIQYPGRSVNTAASATVDFGLETPRR